jgi:23S rRNA (cytosine1962-C5)-methyltransferase
LSDQYQLLDFGDGRRLERFGELVLDRPCPAAEGIQQADPASWAAADARFEGRAEEKGQWTLRRELPERWTVALGGLRFELKRTDFGHVGLFPEQAANWEWIRGTRGEGRKERGEGRQRILNLFAYTGGSTLAAAAAGAEVVHVDAARNIVAWARRNAEQSGLADAPIHWVVEDAQKFVKRELRRGNRYDGLILDPPSYGHGPRGEVWRLSKHLPRLLSSCRELTADRRAFVLLTCHTPGYDVAALRDMMLDALGNDGAITGNPLILRSAAGRDSPSGVAVRWIRR